MNTRLLPVVAGVAMALAWASASAQDAAVPVTPAPDLPARASPEQDAASRLKSHLSAGEFQEAGALLAQIEGEQPELSLELLLLKGALFQERARRADGGVDGDPAIAWAQAHEAYTQALRRSPASGAILNNLALVAAAQGLDASARTLFERAIASEDERRASYAINYARHLADKDRTLARTIAAQAVSAAPENATARQLFVSLSQDAPLSELSSALSAQIDAGRTGLALLLALEAAADDKRAAEPGSEQLVVFAAAAIASDPVMLAKGPGYALLARLDRLTRLGPYASLARPLMRALTEAPPDSLSRFSDWLTSASVPLQPMRTRRAVLRALLLGRGEQVMRSEPGVSERWLKLALDAGDRGPDPDAFLRLVELHMLNGQRLKIDGLMSRYEYELFSEKSWAYQMADWPLIYKMHLALGTTYAYLGKWENPGRPIQSASFQLEHAKIAADRANRYMAGKNQAMALALPASSAMQLSDFYERKGELRKAVALRLDVSQQLHVAARPNESQQLLRTIQPATLNSLGGSSVPRFKSLQTEVDKAVKRSAEPVR